MSLKEIRTTYQLSQVEASTIVGVPLRTYLRYEKDENYGSSLKRNMMLNILIKTCEISENKGILTIKQIKEILSTLFESAYKGKVEYCYLFGSYAKGYAKDNSDVDLFISSSLKGIEFVGLIEACRRALKKKVDLIRPEELNNNIPLLNEIMKDGIKIYEQQER
jgi:predicted nucleotidyltransferase